MVFSYLSIHHQLLICRNPLMFRPLSPLTLPFLSLPILRFLFCWGEEFVKRVKKLTW